VQQGVVPPQLQVPWRVSEQQVFAAGAHTPALPLMSAQHLPARQAQLPPQPSPPTVLHLSGQDGLHTHCPLAPSQVYCAPSELHELALQTH